MKIIELRPDPKLLKGNFDGYKLSLEPIPILKLEDIPKPDQVAPDLSTEYSLHHSTLFQLHNHLVSDPWLSNTAYFLDTTSAIQKIQYDVNIGKLKPLQPVFKSSIKRPATGSGGVYNCDFKFISEKFAVLSDGIGNLRIIETGDRQKNDEWKSVQVLQPLNGVGFIIHDAKFAIVQGEKVIHCLLVHIEQDDGKFFNVVNWITLKQPEGSKCWQEIAKRTLKGKGSLHYLSLDPQCKSVVYSSNHAYKYTADSVNEVIEEAPYESAIENLQVDDSESAFAWTQKGEDITISFKKIPDATKSLFNVESLQSHIKVKYESEFLINSDLFAEVDVELTNWTLEKDFMQLSLVKRNADLIWPYLIPGGPPMEANSDKQPELLNTAPVVDFNAQIEDCDFDGFREDEEFFIERLDATTHKGTHKVFLGMNHPLFARTLRPGFPRAIAIRNDVDCCLWLQQMSPSDDTWELKHESSLHAFGYIQASKRERKYLMCSPDTNLAVISETSRHLFLYKNTYKNSVGLRKRTGSQISIGQQQLVAFDGSNGNIIGMSVENEIILLLTENAICCLQLRIEE